MFLKVNNMNILFEADYSSTDSIINGIKENKIHIKNGKNIVNEPKFKDWLDVVLPSLQKRNIPVSKVFNILVNKIYANKKHLLTTTEYDALKYYVKYRGSPNFKNLFYEFETTQMSLTTFHNEAQKLADNTRNGQRALRKAQTNDEDIEVLYDKNGWTVKSPKTWQASIKAATFPFGKAPWCTASSQAETYFNHYTNKGKHKLFIVSDGTKAHTIQCVLNPDNPDLEDLNNDGSFGLTDLDKFPDEVLKVCKSGDKSLYGFKQLEKKYPNIVKTKKGKDGWTSKTTLRPFGENGFYANFSKYVNGDYDSFDKIKKYMKDQGMNSFVSKNYIKDDKKIWQRNYRDKKIFDKSSNDPDSDFYGVISDADYDKERDLPRKVKSDIYARKVKQEKKEKRTDDFAFEKKTISPEDANYNKLFELGISKYGVKKGENVTITAYYLAPINTQKKYPVIYVNNSKIITFGDKELFKFCIVHYFKKYIKDWQSRGNLLHDVINGNELEEEWKQKVLDILK